MCSLHTYTHALNSVFYCYFIVFVAFFLFVRTLGSFSFCVKCCFVFAFVYFFECLNRKPTEFRLIVLICVVIFECFRPKLDDPQSEYREFTGSTEVPPANLNVFIYLPTSMRLSVLCLYYCRHRHRRRCCCCCCGSRDVAVAADAVLFTCRRAKFTPRSGT